MAKVGEKTHPKLPPLIAIPMKLTSVQVDPIQSLKGRVRGAVPLRGGHLERVPQHRKEIEAWKRRARKEEGGGIWS